MALSQYEPSVAVVPDFNVVVRKNIIIALWHDKSVLTILD